MASDIDAVIWVADGEVVRGRDYGVELEARLVACGLRVSRRDHQDDTQDCREAKYHFLTGGATSVNDTSGWMADALTHTRALLTKAQSGDCTVVGICLGAQMVAQALWPGSVRSGDKIEVGLCEVNWADVRNLPTVVPAFHYEEVDRSAVLAGGGVIIADNTHSAVQGFRFGGRIYGFQFHPELAPEAMQEVVEHHQDTIETYGGSVDTAQASIAGLRDRWSPETFDRILDAIATSQFVPAAASSGV